MPEEDARRPGRQKLRTSCDGCGTSKLRCDRGQPECARCVSHGIACVYGVSRKMGKPPRHKLSSSSSSAHVQVSNDRATADLEAATCDSAIELIDFDASFGQQTSTLPLSDFSTINFNEWPAVDQFDPTIFPNTPESYSTQFGIQPIQASGILPASDQVQPHHECSRKAYAMFGKLSLFDDRSFNTTLAADDVPFDHVLSLSREASEQLSTLLSCSCAPCPSLAFLKASILSKVLSWYHQAAICMQVAASRAPTQIPNSVAPASIAVGTFNVDDERVKAALKIQLLMGEMRRASALIDQFTAHGTVSMYQDEPSGPDGVETLYQHLTTWLKSEHSRISQIMRSKLRELNG